MLKKNWFAEIMQQIIYDEKCYDLQIKKMFYKLRNSIKFELDFKNLKNTSYSLIALLKVLKGILSKISLQK